MKKVKIEDRWIGYLESVFIIAEAGVNHNSKLELAKPRYFGACQNEKLG